MSYVSCSSVDVAVVVVCMSVLVGMYVVGMVVARCRQYSVVRFLRSTNRIVFNRESSYSDTRKKTTCIATVVTSEGHVYKWSSPTCMIRVK
jgi:ABC-type transport system involved in Fe-S cluster assembly fused permease/ATPase subunit